MENLVNLEKVLLGVRNGLSAAENYISEDLGCICDDTMREYADDALESIQKGIEASKELDAIIKNNKLFIETFTEIAVYVGYHQIEFDNTDIRNSTLESWTKDFVQKHAGTDWLQTDYSILVGEYVVEKVNQYRQIHPQPEKKIPFNASFVLGTEAVREYENAVNCGEKWNISSLCDCGGVCTGSFDTEAELKAYKEGIEDATGYLESSIIMTDEEWQSYLEENKDIFSDTME